MLGLLHGAGVTGDDLLLSGTALLGSFTTFSTWMVQSERLAAEGEGGLALVNVAGSLAVGLAAVVLGWALGAALYTERAVEVEGGGDQPEVRERLREVAERLATGPDLLRVEAEWLA